MYKKPTQNKKKPTAEAYRSVLKLMIRLKEDLYTFKFLGLFTSFKVRVTLDTEP